MGRVIVVMSTSLDGFITVSNVRPEEPLGDDGERLHTWAMEPDDRNRQLLEEATTAVGAIIAGRRTYDLSVPWWGADGPTGATRRPVFVVTHATPPNVPDGGVYRFVSDGIESALRLAKAVAEDRDVAVMGGANVAQQFIRAGLVDVIQIQLVPVLFGSGTRLFESIGPDHVILEMAQVVETPAATHLQFRVVDRLSIGA